MILRGGGDVSRRSAPAGLDSATGSSRPTSAALFFISPAVHGQDKPARKPLGNVPKLRVAHMTSAAAALSAQ